MPKPISDTVKQVINLLQNILWERDGNPIDLHKQIVTHGGNMSENNLFKLTLGNEKGGITKYTRLETVITLLAYFAIKNNLTICIGKNGVQIIKGEINE